MLSGLEAVPPRLTLGSHGAVVAAAAAGLGVTLVSEQAVAPLLASGRLEVLPVPGTPLPRPWHLVSAQRSTASAELFVRHVLERPEWSVTGPADG